MAHISYCRFQNTASDFADCLNALENDGLSDLSESEKHNASKLYHLAQEYIDTYEEAVEDENEEN